MFIYCGNQPVTRYDSTGKIWLELGIGYLTYEALKDGLQLYNSKHNSELDSNSETTTAGKLITNQNESPAKDFKYGFYNASWNGCEAIAVHNAKLLMGKSSSLSETIDHFYDANAIIGAGGFGSFPSRIGQVLESYGIKYKCVGIDEMTQSGIYIISYWNASHPFKGLHTIAITYYNEEYRSYNSRYDNDNNYTPAIHGERFICGYFLEG